MFLVKFLLFSFLGVDSMLAMTALENYNYCAKQLNDIFDATNSFILQPPATPTVVTIDIVINSLTGIDDNQQTLTLTFLLTMKWSDPSLKLLDPLCSNLTQKFIVEKALFLNWFPHYIFDNNIRVMFHDSWTSYPAVLSANGEISWKVLLQAQLECTLDVDLFPFGEYFLLSLPFSFFLISNFVLTDHQACRILISSPQYNSAIMQFQIVDSYRAVQLASTGSAKSAVWNIIGQNVEYQDKSYPGVSFKLLLQRQSKFYLTSIILPLLVINIMTAITL